MIKLGQSQLIKDIIALEPLELKSVEIDRPTWERIRPVIKRLQKNGLYYSICECYNNLLLQVKVNDITQRYIDSIL